MSKRKKKNAVTLLSLLFALVVLIGFYVWYSNRSSNSSATENPPDLLSLAKVDTTKVNTVHFTNQSADMTLVLDNKEWKSKDEPDRPINQNNVKNMLNLVSEVRAIKVVNEKPDNLADYGLATPVETLQVTQADGTTLSIKVGNEAATQNGYYAQVNDDSKVYLVATTYGNNLNYSVMDMTKVESGPTITAENITHLDIEQKNGNNLDVENNQNNGLDNSGAGMYSWVMNKPYDGEYTADSSKISELLKKYAAFNFTSCVDYNAKDLSKYGLSELGASIYVGYNETSTQKLDKPEKDPTTGQDVTEKTVYTPNEFKIFIGNKDDTGDNYYVRKDGSNAVYTMSTSDVDPMLTYNSFDLLNKFVIIPNITTLNKVDINIGGKSSTMEVTRKTVKDKDGKDTTESTYYHNGAVV
ncbi:MAG TPA: DUF4340 domain-containing protein, partial [Mobilitalea sp.]|nr:DUF4340 domain-containing protein [Mobilitalea sp.]